MLFESLFDWNCRVKIVLSSLLSIFYFLALGIFGDQQMFNNLYHNSIDEMASEMFLVYLFHFLLENLILEFQINL